MTVDRLSLPPSASVPAKLAARLRARRQLGLGCAIVSWAAEWWDFLADGAVRDAGRPKRVAARRCRSPRRADPNYCGGPIASLTVVVWLMPD